MYDKEDVLKRVRLDASLSKLDKKLLYMILKDETCTDLSNTILTDVFKPMILEREYGKSKFRTKFCIIPVMDSKKDSVFIIMAVYSLLQKSYTVIEEDNTSEIALLLKEYNYFNLNKRDNRGLEDFLAGDKLIPTKILRIKERFDEPTFYILHNSDGVTVKDIIDGYKAELKTVIDKLKEGGIALTRYSFKDENASALLDLFSKLEGLTPDEYIDKYINNNGVTGFDRDACLEILHDYRGFIPAEKVKRVIGISYCTFLKLRKSNTKTIYCRPVKWKTSLPKEIKKDVLHLIKSKQNVLDTDNLYVHIFQSNEMINGQYLIALLVNYNREVYYVKKLDKQIMSALKENNYLTERLRVSSGPVHIIDRGFEESETIKFLEDTLLRYEDIDSCINLSMLDHGEYTTLTNKANSLGYTGISDFVKRHMNKVYYKGASKEIYLKMFKRYMKKWLEEYNIIAREAGYEDNTVFIFKVDTSVNLLQVKLNNFRQSLKRRCFSLEGVPDIDSLAKEFGYNIRYVCDIQEVEVYNVYEKTIELDDCLSSIFWYTKPETVDRILKEKGIKK